jgi:hypothetical protein
VAPLTPEEVYILKHALGKYGSRAVQEAIARVSSDSDRSPSYFLKTLDGIGSTTRHGGLSKLRSGLEK